MRDVARHAGVSVSTVSLVVNGTGYVSAEMRERVEAAMRALNYVPNELARNLYHDRTNMIGVIVPTIRHPFFATLTAGLQRAFSASGLRTLLCSTADADAGEAQYVDMLRRHMMDGIVMAAHTEHDPNYWTSIGRPIVAFDRYLGEGIASVGSDHEQGGRLIADLLIRTGAQHVVMIGGPRGQFHDLADSLHATCPQSSMRPHNSAPEKSVSENSVSDDLDKMPSRNENAHAKSEHTHTASERMHTESESALLDTTFPTVRYYLTLEAQLSRANIRYDYVEAGDVTDFRGYEKAVQNVFDQLGDVDAIVTSDFAAARCVREALSRNIRVPHDLQIVAYDGTYLTDAAGFRLTAICQNFDAICQSIADRMFNAISNNTSAVVPTSDTDILIPVSLRLGETTRA